LDACNQNELTFNFLKFTVQYVSRVNIMSYSYVTFSSSLMYHYISVTCGISKRLLFVVACSLATGQYEE